MNRGRWYLLYPLDREQLAWAAGFFEGEGSIWKRQRKNNQVPTWSIAIGQADRLRLERFRVAVGGLGNIVGPFSPDRNPLAKKEAFRYQVTGLERVQAIIAMMWPFLGSTIKERITGVMN